MTEADAEAFARAAREQKRRPNGHDGAKAERPPLNTIWADEIALDLDTAGLVDGLLPRDGMTVLYGESGSGKTFVTLDLACHIAAGRPWRGMAIDQGVVIYIAAENPKSVERRIWAWKRRHGVEHLPVLVVRSSVDLLEGSTGELVEKAEQMKVTHGRIAAVVVDTLSRAMTGNENAPEDMGKFVAAVGRIA
jgi:RecA-family ATPase